MEEKNKKSSLFPGILIGSISTGILLLIVFIILLSFVTRKNNETIEAIYKTYSGKNDVKPGSDKLLDDAVVSKVNNIENLIDQTFYFTDNIDIDKMRDEMYKGIIKSLDDKYAEYYTAEEFEELFQDSEGIYYGIGSYIEIDEASNYPKLTGIFKDSPASSAGLHDEDLIIAVNGEDLYGYTTTQTVALIKGPEGTTVDLTIKRKGEDQLLYITVTRARIESPTVTYEMKGDKIGYLRLEQFNEVASGQFINAYDDLASQGMRAFILDLRSNGGGNLNTVLEIAEHILPEGIITYTEDKNGYRENYEGKGGNEIMIPMVVLTNEYTASASELLTGAILDYGKGITIGTHTFGKFIVQSVMPLGDGTGVKFTTSSYFTPNGNNYQGTGIMPTIELEYDSDLYYNDNKRDNQIEYAVDYLKKQIK